MDVCTTYVGGGNNFYGEDVKRILEVSTTPEAKSCQLANIMCSLCVGKQRGRALVLHFDAKDLSSTGSSSMNCVCMYSSLT